MQYNLGVFLDKIFPKHHVVNSTSLSGVAQMYSYFNLYYVFVFYTYLYIIFKDILSIFIDEISNI